jgi:hypothetical protein
MLALFAGTASAQDHPNPVVQSIVEWHRQYCFEDLARTESSTPRQSDFGIDEGSIYDIEIGEDQSATVIYKSFTCKGLGHGWCGSGGCGYFIVVEDKIFERQLGFEPLVIDIPIYNGTRPGLLIPLHGTSCEGAAGESMSGADTCYALATWNNYFHAFQAATPLLREVRLEEGKLNEIISKSAP